MPTVQRYSVGVITCNELIRWRERFVQNRENTIRDTFAFDGCCEEIVEWVSPRLDAIRDEVYSPVVMFFVESLYPGTSPTM
jgi:hypothetical protein